MNDAGVLTVADDVYEASRGLRTPLAVHIYVQATMQTVGTSSGRWLLLGMPKHLERRWNEVTWG